MKLVLITLISSAMLIGCKSFNEEPTSSSKANILDLDREKLSIFESTGLSEAKIFLDELIERIKEQSENRFDVVEYTGAAPTISETTDKNEIFIENYKLVQHLDNQLKVQYRMARALVCEQRHQIEAVIVKPEEKEITIPADKSEKWWLEELRFSARGIRANVILIREILDDLKRGKCYNNTTGDYDQCTEPDPDFCKDYIQNI